ncbi:hypothetical protein [Vulgatibacter incomptus]|uniref:hypothetical protein n=1 Tax=Vulgatibacter incomptus TaxID=1391653 RepID=UPI0006836972|nr:hypothetical protein [Vulgatibacter incomptus]
MTPPQVAEVPMIDAEVVQPMRVLAGLGWGAKRIGAELGIARSTVKRYIRDGVVSGIQVHLKQRKLDDDAKAKAVALFDSTAEGCGWARACTLVDCGNRFVVDLTGTFRTDRPVVVRGLADGNEFTCEADESTGFGREQPCSSSGIALENGRFYGESIVHAELMFRGVLCAVDLQVVQLDSVLAEASFAPEYDLVAPNGLACGPLCWVTMASLAPQG